MTAETKVCFECKQTKPAAEFYAQPKHRDGLSTRCRVCFLADMQRRWRAKHPEPKPWVMPIEKICTRCKELKPLDQFVRIKNPAKASRDGYSPDCKPCRSKESSKWNKANPKRRGELALAYVKRHPEETSDRHLRERLGLPPGTYQKMLVAQDGKCAICGTTEAGNQRKYRPVRRFAVDHCHDTLIVRALLCNSCNRGLGNFKHSPEFLRSAASYLEIHEKLSESAGV